MVSVALLVTLLLLWAARDEGVPDAPPTPSGTPELAPPLPALAPATDPTPTPLTVQERERAGTDDDLDVRVVHAATDQPIGGASVYAGWRSTFTSGRGPTVVTDTTGSASLRREPCVDTVVHVAAAGFLRASVTVVAAAVEHDVVVRLTPETPTQVRVVEAATRTPIAGAKVFAARPLRVAETRAPGARTAVSRTYTNVPCTEPTGITDASGLATLSGVGSGFHDVLAIADGFLTGRRDEVELPPEPAPLEIALEPGHTIAVVVQDEAGRPVVDREVTVLDLRGDESFFLRTDERGCATSPGFAVGRTVRLQVARPDLGNAAQLLESIAGAGRADVVVPVAEPVRLVVPEHRSRAIDCVWEPGAAGDRLRLTAFGQQGAERYLFDYAEAPASRGHWQSGSCTIGEPFFEAVGTRSGLWRSETAVPQPGGIPRAVLTERVPRDASLTVVCQDADGSPVADAVVTLSALASDLGMSIQVLPAEATSSASGDAQAAHYTMLARSRSDATGRVHFPALLPGRHVLAAQHGHDGAGTAVVMVAGATTHTLVLAPTGEVRGRVTGCPPAGQVTVAIRAADSPWRSSVAVAADGAFTATLAAGRYELSAHLANVSLDGSRLLAVDSSRQRIEVLAGGTTACYLALSASVRQVEVAVLGVDPTSHEVLAERVHPYDRVGASRWVTSRPIGRDGIARFERLEAEAAFGLLLVRRSDGRVVAQHDLERHVSGRIELRLSTSTQVTVQAVAVAAAEVRLVPLHAYGTLLREAMRAPDIVEGDTARFRDVPAGRYRLVTLGAIGRVRRERRPDVEVGAAELAIVWQ
jgi:hypothetical protein